MVCTRFERKKKPIDNNSPIGSDIIVEEESPQLPERIFAPSSISNSSKSYDNFTEKSNFAQNLMKSNENSISEKESESENSDRKVNMLNL